MHRNCFDVGTEANEFLNRLIVQKEFLTLITKLIVNASFRPLKQPANNSVDRGQMDLAGDLNEVLNELSHGEGDAAYRVFNQSFNLPQLNNGGRAALLALSLFTPSASRPALAEVAGMDLSKLKDKKRFKKLSRLSPHCGS